MKSLFRIFQDFLLQAKGFQTFPGSVKQHQQHPANLDSLGKGSVESAWSAAAISGVIIPSSVTTRLPTAVRLWLWRVRFVSQGTRTCNGHWWNTINENIMINRDSSRTTGLVLCHLLIVLESAILNILKCWYGNFWGCCSYLLWIVNMIFRVWKFIHLWLKFDNIF